MSRWTTVATVLTGLVLATSCGVAGGDTEDYGDVTVPDLGHDELPEVPDNATRIFEEQRGDLDDYAVVMRRITDEGETTVEMWSNEEHDRAVDEGVDLGEEHFHLFTGVEGDTFDLDGHTVTLVEVNPDHVPDYVTVALD